MSDRKELFEELKRESKLAWRDIKNCAKKISQYALIAFLSISGTNSPKMEDAKLAYMDGMKGQHRLEVAIDNKDLAKTKDYLLGKNFIKLMETPLFDTRTPEEQAIDLYKEIAKDNGTVDIKTLLDAGVTTEVIQEEIDKDPNLLQQLQPGQTSQKLASAANRQRGKLEGKCLSGVQEIFAWAGLGDVLSGQQAEWPEKLKGARWNSACNAYYPLEKSGEFINLSIPNKAYKKSRNSAENQEMRAYINSLPAGTIVILDSAIPPEDRDNMSYAQMKRKCGVSQSTDGHIGVINAKGVFTSDAKEPNGPNCARYGETMIISANNDTNVPEDFAIRLLTNKIVKDIENNQSNGTFLAMLNRMNTSSQARS